VGGIGTVVQILRGMRPNFEWWEQARHALSTFGINAKSHSDSVFFYPILIGSHLHLKIKDSNSSICVAAESVIKTPKRFEFVIVLLMALLSLHFERACFF